MISLEQTRNGCGYDHVLEAESTAISVAMCPVGSEGGVGKPGGFTTTSDDPRAGGSVVLPGGLGNTTRQRGSDAFPSPARRMRAGQCSLTIWL